MNKEAQHINAQLAIESQFYSFLQIENHTIGFTVAGGKKYFLTSCIYCPLGA